MHHGLHPLQGDGRLSSLVEIQTTGTEWALTLHDAISLGHIATSRPMNALPTRKMLLVEVLLKRILRQL
ncbi:hypothetical protein K443DRAFT_372326 [Laccaria amethystina LaAM-08-1]|uniref:Uncharacterized protein n=1 Tax=Laccaria amethystina LaAM-08-1 TaxID=1095629 RepID=A0A0C9X8R1_9AGAR|nr:hypothetical protein K443DRAFT_372326 [Laccaria amethystina LaAM-08-1]